MSDDLTLLIGRIGCAIAVLGYIGYWLWNKMKNRGITENNDLEEIQHIDEQTIVDDSIFSQLSENAMEYTVKVQEETLRTYFDSNENKYDRFHINMEEGTLTFYSNDVPMVQANIQVVGSYSKNSNTWMWSLLNASIPAISSDKMIQVKEFLEVIGWGDFDDVIEVDEGFISHAVYFSLMVLQGVGFYRAPSTHSDVYVVMTDINWVKG